jgi:hypothetical protein
MREKKGSHRALPDVKSNKATENVVLLGRPRRMDADEVRRRRKPFFGIP